MSNYRAVILTAAASVLVSTGLARAGILADSYVSYTAGDFTDFPSEATLTNPSAALGALTGDTDAGTPYGANGLNPFDPPFTSSQIVAVGAGGELTLHLSSSVGTTGGATLGVFSNNGLDDVSSDGSGLATNPAVTFDDPDHPEAIVSVSTDGISYVGLDGKPVTTSTAPTIFANPTNYYLDSEINEYTQPLGTEIADQYKPFTGTLSSFDGETYDQIKATLDGSAGGTWLDLSSTGLTSVNYIEFSVPSKADYSFVVDSVSAVPEPVIGLPLAMSVMMFARRRRR